MAGDGYPGVEWIPAHKKRHTEKHSRTIDAIVLHCTDGRSTDARRTARNVFASAPEIGADGKKHSQSAHYIVGRDGAVIQCVRHKDIAFHANKENPSTIGIEHNAREPEDTTLTDIQYWNSAGLVVWLGQRLGIPMDRWYIWGHSEIDTTTTHRSCPQRALDWDTYMLAIADVQAVANGQKPSRVWTGEE